MEKALLECNGGLGSKLLDMIGFCVFSTLCKLNPVINFDANPTKYEWGKNIYDKQLFQFENMLFTQDSERIKTKIISSNPAFSFCPYKIYEYLGGKVPFEIIARAFQDIARMNIHASPIIEEYYPRNIEQAYGIHMRFSDKVKQSYNPRYENSIEEARKIKDKILEEIDKIIKNEDTPIFFVVSEDKAWRARIEGLIKTQAKEANKDISFIQLTYNDDYDGFDSVLDLFCLSKCKAILQGVKYSSFSTVAALLGDKPIINFCQVTNNPEECLTPIWNSVVNINGEKVCNVEINKKLCDTIKNMVITG